MRREDGEKKSQTLVLYGEKETRRESAHSNEWSKPRKAEEGQEEEDTGEELKRKKKRVYRAVAFHYSDADIPPSIFLSFSFQFNFILTSLQSTVILITTVLSI